MDLTSTSIQSTAGSRPGGSSSAGSAQSACVTKRRTKNRGERPFVLDVWPTREKPRTDLGQQAARGFGRRSECSKTEHG